MADATNDNQPTLSLYVQGQRVDLIINPTPSPRTSLTGQPLMIGRENVGNTNSPAFFNGNIDEVRISREAVYLGSRYFFANGIEAAWARPDCEEHCAADCRGFFFL